MPHIFHIHRYLRGTKIDLSKAAHRSVRYVDVLGLPAISSGQAHTDWWNNFETVPLIMFRVIRNDLAEQMNHA